MKLKWTIKEIEKKLVAIKDEQDDFFRQLQQDERKGVQTLINKWHREQRMRKLQHERFLEMTVYEKKYRKAGYQLIAGIDEVGRGPLAGPVVAAAVILPGDFYLPGIDDSKKLTEQKREHLYQEIKAKAIAIGLGIIDNNEIDHINIFAATKKAMMSAISQLEPKPEFLLIDAMKLDTPYPQESIIKGDGLSISIAAASIVAKVTRDRMLKEYDLQYPNYGFANHAGYGTKEHLESIQANGITPIHRKSFAPIKEYISRG
ncbi:ribonuclease HII [Bacillus tuaregi]|uniref:ribonuclease HII n=1 Tax=Bacillus tuaregi TaxID=1816695 RepID=UPI0008F82D57|nr:ribonuclease HII [Bacillus tuaregi]